MVEEEENAQIKKKGICVYVLMCVHTVHFGDAASTKRYDNIYCIDAAA